ncbi:hypothetical protein Bbelb_317550 [Branchiostoma belcheri]|nr:hypothetical protein Bbelb_317550 [Branchiostoma belcheri]
MDGPPEKCKRYPPGRVPTRTLERWRYNERKRKAEEIAQMFATPATEPGNSTVAPVAGPSNATESADGWDSDGWDSDGWDIDDPGTEQGNEEAESGEPDGEEPDGEPDGEDPDGEPDGEEPDGEPDGEEPDLVSETELLTPGEDLYPGAPLTTEMTWPGRTCGGKRPGVVRRYLPLYRTTKTTDITRVELGASSRVRMVPYTWPRNNLKEHTRNCQYHKLSQAKMTVFVDTMQNDFVSVKLTSKRKACNIYMAEIIEYEERKPTCPT